MSIAVSVIIPCYKQAHFLPECIASLQAQSRGDWEAIVVNDGSPDNTSEVVAQLAASDARIRCIEQANAGLSAARNAGMAMAQGQWIQFLDADDLLLPEKLALSLVAAQTTPDASLVVTDYEFLNRAGDRVSNDYCQPRLYGLLDLWSEFALRWEVNLSIPIHAALFRRSLLNGLTFDSALPNHEDFDFWLRLMDRRPMVLNVPEVLVLYRLSENSMSRQRDRMELGFLQVVDKHLQDSQPQSQRGKVLAAKRKLIRHQYRGAGIPVMGKIVQSRLFRKNVPWPIQSRLVRWKYLDLDVRLSSMTQALAR